MGESIGIDSLLGGGTMPKAYPGDMQLTVTMKASGAAVKSWSEAARQKSNSQGERTAGAATR
jgi:hypothetical protein